MAEKKVIGNLKLRIPAGRATAGPPVGSTLGQWGLNMMDFINPFNEKTKDLMGKNVIVHIRVFEDRTFDWKSLGQPVIRWMWSPGSGNHRDNSAQRRSYC